MTGTQIINIHVFNTPLTLILSFFLLNWVHYQSYKNAPFDEPKKIEDAKIPAKKGKAEISHREMFKLKLSLFCLDFAIFNTEQVKTTTLHLLDFSLM